jgi:hypothetical protein
MRGLAVLLAVVGVAAGPPAARADGYTSATAGDFAPIELEIRNDTAAALRCVVILAHFITRTPDTLAPGEALTLVLDRDAATGALGYGSHNGQPMLIENILCGRDDAWDATRTDIPLTSIRVGVEEAYGVACTIEGRVTCSARP